MHRDAPKASGGVRILVKQWLCQEYHVSVMDKSVDGILGLKVTHRVSERELVVFSCYLPPEGSTHGRNAQAFFSHLLTQIYINSNSDYIFIGGDFNARIGTLSDVSTDNFTITTRQVLDRVINQHGHEFTKFLNDSNFCTLNGRFESDNYISISRKGKAVVDYVCVPLDT